MHPPPHPPTQSGTHSRSVKNKRAAFSALTWARLGKKVDAFSSGPFILRFFCTRPPTPNGKVRTPPFSPSKHSEMSRNCSATRERVDREAPIWDRVHLGKRSAAFPRRSATAPGGRPGVHLIHREAAHLCHCRRVIRALIGKCRLTPGTRR